MKLMTRALALTLGLSLCPFAALVSADDRAIDRPAAKADEAKPEAGKEKKERQQIEVCFVLDTTGSMTGLIEGAKAKIWSIANTIIAVKDKPQIKIALIGYRDKGDEYVTRVHDLTDDIDAVFKNLQAFKADGGGDTPESVNEALHQAVTKVAWSDKKDVAKIIFLVGDAPPHMDYKDDVKYPETLKLAKEKGIVVNAVQCGTMAETTPVWKEIAQLGQGSYIPLAQEGNVIAIATPFDKDLAELNAKVTATAVAYGAVAQQQAVASKVAVNASLPTVAADAPALTAHGGTDYARLPRRPCRLQLGRRPQGHPGQRRPRVGLH